MQITLFVNKRLPHRKRKSKELNLKENVEFIRALVTVVTMNEVPLTSFRFACDMILQNNSIILNETLNSIQRKWSLFNHEKLFASVFWTPQDFL